MPPKGSRGPCGRTLCEIPKPTHYVAVLGHYAFTEVRLQLGLPAICFSPAEEHTVRGTRFAKSLKRLLDRELIERALLDRLP